MTPVTSRETRSTCCYCGTGCGVIIESDGAQITGVRGDPDHPANFGKLCTKGLALAKTSLPIAMTGRARRVSLRRERTAARKAVGWDEALDFMVERFADTIRTHGRDAVAFYVSGQLLTEDYYAFNKLAKGLIGTNNIDTNSRLCMSSAVTGYQQTLGVDAPPCSYEDIDHAQCFFIAGSNAAFAHPILFRRIEAAKEKNPAVRIVVVDPRKTETAAFADLHLQILPGTDVALFHAMLHVMLWEELIDRAYIVAHCDGFDALREQIREMTPAAASEICGVPTNDIITAARWFAQSPATLSLYCQGLNQSSSGTAKNASLINLHLATGQIGKTGAGPFSLTGQPNAMGGREVGGLATTLAAHRSIENPVHREEVRAFWGAEQVSETRGKTAVEMFEAIARGEIKIVWIICTNPAQSLPNLAAVQAALEKAELVIVQEAYENTETTAFADVLLPASSWGEKEGTVTNSERRISRVRAAVNAPGDARADWEIATEFARRLERKLRAGAISMFTFSNAEAVWNEHRALTRGRDLDITGLSYTTLENNGPQQWPYPQEASVGTARLYVDGQFHTPNGRAKFFAAKYQPVTEKVDAHYPFHLTTGRLRDQWHSMSRSGTHHEAFAHTAEPALEMNVHDMARRGLAAGDLASVQSRRGRVYVRVAASDALRSGQVYLPMHWGKRYLGGSESAGVNTLTNPSMDGFSRQPELKHAAVKVVPAALAWQLVAFACAIAVHKLDAISALQGEVAFMSVTPIGNNAAAVEGVLVRVAHHGAPTKAWLAAFDQLLGLDQAQVLRYDDERRGAARRMRIDHDQLRAVRLSGSAEATNASEWLREWALSARSVVQIRRLLLAPAGTPPVGMPLASRTVCQCFQISEDEITATLAACAGEPRERLAALQSALGCGTNCGSCLPELRKCVSCVSTKGAVIA